MDSDAITGLHRENQIAIERWVDAITQRRLDRESTIRRLTHAHYCWEEDYGSIVAAYRVIQIAKQCGVEL